jgi:Flp pilus assembly protein TadD
MPALQGERTKDSAAVQTRTQGVDPDLGICYRDQAIKFSLQDRFAESENYSREALRLRPDDVDVLNELGVAVWRQGRPAEAEAIYLRARQIDPNDFRILTNMGLALQEQGRFDEAAELYRRALQIRPDTYEAVMNLGVVISNQGYFDEATEWLQAAQQLRPDSADALQNVGMNLGRQGRWQEAIHYYEQALRQRPEFPEGHRNLAYALLGCGDYERGWPEHEWRLKCKPHSGHRINRTFWNGDHFHARTILLHAEQGFGDTLQFIRYTSMVKGRGGQVLVLCPSSLLRLVARCEGVDLAFDGSSYVPDCHLHAPMLSLPAIFGTTLATVPAHVPYLAADALLVEHWRTKLARAVGIDEERAQTLGESTLDQPARPFLIGIAWQGNPAQFSDQWRSFPLAQFAPLARLPGVRLVSLQVEHGLDQLPALAGRFPVTDLTGPRRRDFMDSAAVMSHLDLVITPDTAVAHLAGGLGVRTWVGLCSVGDWRYPHGCDETPWYPTMRVFRQPRFGDWDSVFQRMTDALQHELQRISGRPAALIPRGRTL